MNNPKFDRGDIVSIIGAYDKDRKWEIIDYYQSHYGNDSYYLIRDTINLRSRKIPENHLKLIGKKELMK